MSEQNQTNKPKLDHPAAGQRGMTELHYAAYCNDPYAVRVQLQQGVSVDVRDDNGWTPLHWSIDMAQAGGKPEQVVAMLLAAGASPNAVGQSECSALMMACGRNNESILQQLIEAGADIHSRRRSGGTLLHEAAGCNFSEAIRRLLMLGLDPHQIDDRNQTPEEVAEYCGFDESIAVFKAAKLTR